MENMRKSEKEAKPWQKRGNGTAVTNAEKWARLSQKRRIVPQSQKPKKGKTISQSEI
jgi:hypothetical protein